MLVTSPLLDVLSTIVLSGNIDDNFDEEAIRALFMPFGILEKFE